MTMPVRMKKKKPKYGENKITYTRGSIKGKRGIRKNIYFHKEIIILDELGSYISSDLQDLMGVLRGPSRVIISTQSVDQTI